jgi:PPOX class probable FMN-dependent enzyme
MVRDEAGLREIYPDASDIAVRKSLRRLEEHSRNILAASPFIVIATFGPNGADVSPRGDPPGFVHVLDDRHLLIPDRPGNNRLDTLTNLLANPAIGIIVMVPGVAETLRINGTGMITRSNALLASCAIDGKLPLTGIVVTIEEMFLHCPKALVRSHLWKPDHWPARGTLPSAGRIFKDHLALAEDVDALDAWMERAVKDTLY